MPVLDYLPEDLAPSEVRACVAIVSDTHMPRRCREFPPALFDVLTGADLVLHAGDVGKLWVLDQLSRIAPIVAVHGNDESREAKRSLPYSTIVHVGGERIFLWHGHHDDPHLEQNARQGEEIIPKLQRTIDGARQVGASLAVFGHWHIPLVYDADDLLVVNPGAIASGNEVTRQLHQTVALAWLAAGELRWRIVHVAVSSPPSRWDATVEWEQGFTRVGARYQESIFDPSLAVRLPVLMATLPPELLSSLRDLTFALAHRVWAGELPRLTPEILLAEAQASSLLSPALIDELLLVLADSPHFPNTSTS